MSPSFTKLGSMLRSQFRGVYERGIRLQPQSENPYSTHVPILIGIASAFAPDSLIEFGAGTLSTLSFLDEMVFPSFQRIVSYENNKEWFDQLRAQLAPGGRVDFRFVEGEMYTVVDSANTAEAAMVFIDDSPNDIDRVPTVVEVAAKCGPEPIVVMHDAGLWRLRVATRKFEHRVYFDAYNPQTCVMWHGHPERRAPVAEVKRLVAKYADQIATTDIRGWKAVFAKELAAGAQAA